MTKRFLALLLLVGLAGCDLFGSDEPDALSIQTVQPSYAAGDVPVVELMNETGKPAALPSCGPRRIVAVEKRAAGRLEGHFGTLCLDIYATAFDIAAEDGTRWPTQQIDEPGTYRIVQEVKLGSKEPRVLRSNTFRVK